MMRRIRNSTFTKIFWGLMGIYLLNISVDSADPYPEYIPEDLSFNDQESIVEIVAEQMLGFENAIQEYDDHDPEDHNREKNVKIDLLVHFDTTNRDSQRQCANKKKRFFYNEALLTSAFIEIASPPPKS